MRMLHKCKAVGCDRTIPVELLMCRRHWAQVPWGLRRAVRENYRAGQCIDLKPSSAWRAAADAAIAAVAAREGHLRAAAFHRERAKQWRVQPAAAPLTHVVRGAARVLEVLERGGSS